MAKEFYFRGRKPIDRRLAESVQPDTSEWRHAKKEGGATMCGADPNTKPKEVGSMGICLDCLTECFKEVK
jgi:hypothetical protein